VCSLNRKWFLPYPLNLSKSEGLGGKNTLFTGVFRAVI